MNEFNEIYNWMISTTKRVKKILSKFKNLDEFSYNPLDQNLKNNFDHKLLSIIIDFQLNLKLLKNDMKFNPPTEKEISTIILQNGEVLESDGDYAGQIILIYEMFKDSIDEFFQNCRLDDPSKELVEYRIFMLIKLLKILTSVADFSKLKPI